MENRFKEKIAAFYPVSTQGGRPNFYFSFTNLPSLYSFNFSFALIAIDPAHQYTFTLKVIDESGNDLITTDNVIASNTIEITPENLLSSGLTSATFNIFAAAITINRGEHMLHAIIRLCDGNKKTLDQSETWFVTRPDTIK